MARIKTGLPQKGHPHRMSAARIAQLHRWQMLGAAARKGQRTAGRDLHHARKAAARKKTIQPIGRAVAWGISKTAVPTQLVAPFIPGYQPGDRTFSIPKRAKQRR
jgi:hypothetical protein